MIWAVRSVICLPTYNEHENIEPMVRALRGLDLDDLHVLVIDDSSPDGTGEIADRLAAEEPLQLILDGDDAATRKLETGAVVLDVEERDLSALRELTRPGLERARLRARWKQCARLRVHQSQQLQQHAQRRRLHIPVQEQLRQPAGEGR